MTDHVLTGPLVYSEQGILKDTVVSIHRGRIHDIVKKEHCHAKPTLTFPSHYHLVPGFIDCHLHGANNADVMDGSFEAYHCIARALVAEGTTGYLATTLTAPLQDIEKTILTAASIIKEGVPQGAKLLGIHLEGPFISPKKIGAQRSDYILAPNIALFDQWQAISQQAIKLVTLAPDLPNGLEFIRALREREVIVSIGHTDATYSQAMDAIQAGANYATHLFNAMRAIHQREPGVVMAALLNESVMTEVIADGIHLHPAILQCILRLKQKEKMILVTDAIRAKCLAEGVYDLGGHAVTVKDNQATLADGTLAGSVLKMPTAIQNMLRFTGCSLWDAVCMASHNPATVLGIFDQTGSIATGKAADLVVLDGQLRVVLTMIDGEIVFSQL